MTNWLKNPKHILLMTGPVGTGKTYFCSAVLERMFGKVQHCRAHKEGSLFRRLRQGFSENSAGDYLTHLKGLIDDEFIIIDDVGSTGHTDWREEILMEAIDYRYTSGLPTLITSNLSRKQFYEIYNTRIGSRLFAKRNTIIDLEGMPDLRQVYD